MKCGVIIQGHLYPIQVNGGSKPSRGELSTMSPLPHHGCHRGVKSEWRMHLGAWIDFFLLKNAEYNSITYLQLKSSLASRWKVISRDYLNFLSVQQNISGQSSQWIEATDRHLSGSLAKSPLRRGDRARLFSFIYT